MQHDFVARGAWLPLACTLEGFAVQINVVVCALSSRESVVIQIRAISGTKHAELRFLWQPRAERHHALTVFGVEL